MWQLPNKRSFLVFLCLFLCLTVVSGSTVKLENENVEDQKIHIHFVSHTHDDVGWTSTVDEYHYQETQYILDTVIQSLLTNKERKFTYVEMGFFTRWYKEISKETKEQVHFLVDNGQLTFALGGWCMNDEAGVHYNSIIDQMSLGHKFLIETFNIKPRVGWQLDPFGHSSTLASLFSTMGFDALYFARMDLQDRAERMKKKTLQMLWRGSESLGRSNQLFTQLFKDGYYWPGEIGFDDFNRNIYDNDDLNLPNNVKHYVDYSVNYAQSLADTQRSKNVFFPMGGDFKYQNAQKIYKNLDKLIKHINEDGRMTASHSTPDMYTDAVFKENIQWPVKEKSDFFPYSDDKYDYWTGYFTSRVGLKRLERYNMAYLQTCRHFEAMNKKKSSFSSDELLDAMATLQHHDGVSGTSKQYVAGDYSQRVSIGAKECDSLIEESLKNQMSASFKTCHLLNMTNCDVTENNRNFYVAAYNPLAANGRRCQTLRVPVNFEAATVLNEDGKEIGNQITKVTKEFSFFTEASHELEFEACADPLSIATFNVKRQQQTEQLLKKTSRRLIKRSSKQIFSSDDENEHILKNEKVSVHVSITSGMITKIVSGSLSVDIKQEFLYYIPNTGDKDATSSDGAYVFRALDQKGHFFGNPKDVSIVGKEIRVEINDWLSQIIRLEENANFVSVEILIKSILITDVGKEVVVRYGTDLQTAKTFYTDSNGRELIKRVTGGGRDFPFTSYEYVAENYYPINTRILLNEDNRRVFTVATDRSVGGGSLKSGEVELMLHRRLLHDDYKGVNEALNEPPDFQAKESIDNAGLALRSIQKLSLFDNLASSRALAHENVYPLQFFFSKDQPVKSTLAGPLINELPHNVHLLTLERLSAKKFLVRLDHHYDVHDGSDASSVATVDLHQLFSFGNLEKIVEVSMTANQRQQQINRLKWRAEDDEQVSFENDKNDTISADGVVTLRPQQIKTFVLHYF